MPKKNKIGVYESRIKKAIAQEKHQRTDDGTDQENYQTCADSGLWETRHGHLASQESSLRPCVSPHNVRVGRHHQGIVQINVTIMDGLLCSECGCPDVVVYDDGTCECQGCGFVGSIDNFLH